MDGIETDWTRRQQAGFGQRLSQALPALLLALIIVLGALAVTKPWRDTPSGLAPQVQPASANERDLATAPSVGNLAPNFRLTSLDGDVVELADLRGRPVFVNFWATWCLFCVTEMPAMQRLADRYGEAIAVVGVNVGESEETASIFATNFDIDYLLVLDESTDVARAFQVGTMPTSFFLDADGVVREVRYGPVMPDQMVAALQPLIDETSTN